MKNGILTTEFISTIASIVVTYLVSRNIITSDQSGVWVDTIVQIALAVMSIIAVIQYNRNRTELKKQEMNLQNQDLQVKINTLQTQLNSSAIPQQTFGDLMNSNVSPSLPSADVVSS